MKFPTYDGEVPYVTTEQMIEVDRAMIEDYKIELIQMMENAGRNLAHVARHRFLDSNPTGKKVVILAGIGGNGGGALVCARHLKNYGADIVVFTTKPDEDFAPIPARQLDILRQMDTDIRSGEQMAFASEIDLIIDGVIGYSLKGEPHGAAADMIRWANNTNAPILALDAPSGVDTTSGTVFEPAIKAAATMTLALPKEGLRADGVEAQVGELYLADISVPPELYASAALGLTVGHLFMESDVIRLW